MFDIIKGYLAQFKLYLIIALIAVVTTAWLFDRHSQYNAGVAYATEQQHEAQTKYEQGKIEQEEKDKKRLAQEATDAANHINVLENSVKIEKEKQRVKIIAHPTPVICDLSNDEWVQFNATINRLQR